MFIEFIISSKTEGTALCNRCEWLIVSKTATIAEEDKLAMLFRPFKVKLFALKTLKRVKILKISELPAFSIADL